MLVNDFGDSKVTILKTALLESIQKNREQHEVEYREAYAGYVKVLRKSLEKCLALVADGKEVDRNKLLAMQEPTSHTKDYDRVILMLEMSVATEITISEQQFRQYVLDEWAWMAQFKGVSATYHGR